MKKNLSLAFLSLSLIACSTSKDEPLQPKQNVEVSLSYIFADNGNMARSKGSEAYETFYNNQIKTKKLAPQHYELTFTEKTNGAIYKHSGKWDNNTKINILEGNYNITGFSAPQSNTIDTLYLSFNEDVTITKEIANISLTAKNNCYLLLFNAESLSNVNYRSWSTTQAREFNSNLKSADNLFFMFVKNFIYDVNTLKVNYKNGEQTGVVIDNIPFSKGKYYYFNEVSYSFDIPAMEEGN